MGDHVRIPAVVCFAFCPSSVLRPPPAPQGLGRLSFSWPVSVCQTVLGVTRTRPPPNGPRPPRRCRPPGLGAPFGARRGGALPPCGTGCERAPSWYGLLPHSNPKARSHGFVRRPPTDAQNQGFRRVVLGDDPDVRLGRCAPALGRRTIKHRAASPQGGGRDRRSYGEVLNKSGRRGLTLSSS